uniref:50S ribosomal protein L35 n=1 Tax=Davidia involucrata TaxID=16924 RepID=A0A5B7BXV6_DAVIN
MQRWCAKLRSLVVLHSTQKSQLSLSSSCRLLHSSPHLLHKPIAFTVISSNFKPLFNGSRPSLFNQEAPRSSLLPLSFIQVRHITKQEKKTKRMTPVTSKIKKIKMKSYSSYKGRFRTMNDGRIRRWKEGKRHNAHLKSKSAKRRLRRPGIVPLAYAKVMKKLNFCG